MFVISENLNFLLSFYSAFFSERQSKLSSNLKYWESSCSFKFLNFYPLPSRRPPRQKFTFVVYAFAFSCSYFFYFSYLRNFESNVLKCNLIVFVEMFQDYCSVCQNRKTSIFLVNSSCHRSLKRFQIWSYNLENQYPCIGILNILLLN